MPIHKAALLLLSSDYLKVVPLLKQVNILHFSQILKYIIIILIYLENRNVVIKAHLSD